MNQPSVILGRYGLMSTALLTATAFLILDIYLPLGIAGGVTYVATVLLGLWFPNRRQVIAITLICCLLVAVGYAFSPEGGILWKVYFNRALAIFAIVSTGTVIYIAKTAALRTNEEASFPSLLQETASDAPEESLRDQFSATGYRGLLAAFPVLLLIIGGSIWISRETEDSRQWVSHTHEVTIGLGRILSALQDAETGQRGYLLTGEANYLEPFNEATANLDRVVQVVRKLTADNPEQQERLDKAIPLIDEKLEELHKTISLFHTIGSEAALNVVKTDRGKNLMDQLRAIIAEMVAEEESLLGKREQTLEAEEALARAINYIGFAVILLIGLLVVYRLRALIILRDEGEKQLRIANMNADRANQELQHLAENLETLVEQRTEELQTALITQKQAQEQLLQSSKMATLGEMATGLAHELNQPLNVIRLAIANVQRKLDKGVIEPDYLLGKLERVVSQVERAAEIIDHMRIFGRKSAGDMIELDGEKIIKSVLGLIGQQLRLSNIHITTEASGVNRRFLGHQVQIEQVLLNLLTNARDTLNETQKTDKQITIRIYGDDDNGSVCIDVEDNGGGIPDDVLPKIFEPFYTTKDVGKGTGLGLSISYGIIADMNGTVAANNTDNGACFTITLPAYDPNQAT